MATRPKILKFRVTEEEEAELLRQASDAGVGISQYLRETLLKRPDEPGPAAKQPSEDPGVDVDELEYKLQPQKAEHLARFPNDKHADSQRIRFDAEVRRLITKEGMAPANAKLVAAHDIFKTGAPGRYKIQTPADRAQQNPIERKGG